MSLLKKHRIVIGLGIAALTIGMFILLNNRMLPEPVVIYKATEPASRKTPKNVDEQANHTHSHDNTTHTHTPEVPLSENSYDWRDDAGLDTLRPKTNPWKQIHVSDDPAPTIPDLESTEDPRLRAKYLYDILLNQFGDIPEVHTIGEYEHNAAQGIPPTLDEYIDFLEAHMSLWPNNKTLSTLEEMRRVKADGVPVVFKRSPQ